MLEDDILTLLYKYYETTGGAIIPNTAVTQALVIFLHGSKNEDGGSLHRCEINLSPFVKKSMIRSLVTKELTEEELLSLQPYVKSHQEWLIKRNKEI